MPVISGQTLSHYRLLKKIGEGGMGVVWKAEDTVLNRQVAIKVLPADLAVDEDRRRMFLDEARLAASVSHGNIVQVHELGREGDLDFIVMEHVEGKPLNKILHGRPLPPDKVVELGLQVAQGLARAHRKKLVHRDLKPANILVTGDGEVKIVDFGLATLFTPEDVTTAVLTTTPTAVPNDDKRGAIAGTLPYMSPEQVRGETLDARSDIFSLGSVLYEMTTGQRPFLGATRADVAKEVLKSEPIPVPELVKRVPLDLHRIIHKSLARRPADRYQHTDDVVVDLKRLAKELESGSSPTFEDLQPASIPRRWPLKTIGAVVGGIVVVLIVNMLLQRESRPTGIQVGRTTQSTRARGLEIDPALSPNGQMLAYASGLVGQMKVQVQHGAGGRVIQLAESVSGNQRHPQWSPDGNNIAFTVDNKVYVVPALGGSPNSVVTLPDGEVVHGFAWSPDGEQIAYVKWDYEECKIVVRRVEGGQERILGRAEDQHSLSWSPDGSKIAYVMGNSGFVEETVGFGNRGLSSIWVVSTRGQDSAQVTDHSNLNVSPVWAANSRSILFVSSRGGGRDIYEQPLHVSGAPDGEPVRLTTGLQCHSVNLSASGTHLAYSLHLQTANIWTVRVPRPAEGTLTAADASQVTFGSQKIEGIGISRDGQWLVFDSNQNGNADIFKMPVAGGEPTQLTFDPADEFNPSWADDGTKIAFHLLREGIRDVYMMAADGSWTRRVTNDPSNQESNPHLSPDGTKMAYRFDRGRGLGAGQIHVIGLDEAGGPPQQIWSGGGAPRWSPTGRLIAHCPHDGTIRIVTPESGVSRALVEAENGAVPVHAEWSADGRTVYYKTFKDGVGSSFWSVPFDGGVPTLLVRLDHEPADASRPEFATDGNHFYYTVGVNESDIWTMELKQR